MVSADLYPHTRQPIAAKDRQGAVVAVSSAFTINEEIRLCWRRSSPLRRSMPLRRSGRQQAYEYSRRSPPILRPPVSWSLH